MTALPLVLELDPALTVSAAWSRLRQEPGCLLLESARQQLDPGAQPRGRYSFLTADPFATVCQPVGVTAPWHELRRLLSEHETSPVPGLPPFQGGLAGVFSYDLNRSLERLPAPAWDEFQLPALVVGAYDQVIAWDHQESRVWLISQGFPARTPAARLERAQQRSAAWQAMLAGPEPGPRSFSAEDRITPVKVQPLCRRDLPGLGSDFLEAEYLAAVSRSLEYIRAGDIFQVNLSQRLLYPAADDAAALYQRLRSRNPATFAAYLDTRGLPGIPDFQVVSASPERLISVREGLVETRPIKGTRPRTGQPRVDLREQNLLLASVKDRAENTMIVDLMRNDLSRVCEDDSICVTDWCRLEAYQSVLHLVSVVQGRLRPNASLVDLLEAVFPGGSITGAPKIRAMEIIAELEPTARGPYCGSLGYLGFDGSADLSILIRTITAAGGWWQIPVGGGIVQGSDPHREYAETWTKAASMLAALKPVPAAPA